MGKGGSAPPPPDYRAAAKETAAGDLEAARAASAANRVNQVTPYGSLTYSQNEGLDNFGNPTFTATQTLSPAQQRLLDYQNATSEGLGELTGKGLGYVENMLDDPFTTQNLPSLGFDPAQSFQDAYMARLQPQIEQSQEALDTRLANAGIPIGSEAYNRAQMTEGRRVNDLRLGATTQGFGTGLAARQQGFNEAAYQRNEPLNTLNAVRTGSQVTNPSYVSVPQQATTKGADLLGAATAEGNYNTASANADAAKGAGMTSGLFSLAGTAAMAF